MFWFFCNKILPKIILIISDDHYSCQKHLVIACDVWSEVSHVALVNWLLCQLPDWQDGWIDDRSAAWTPVDGCNF